MLHFILEYSVYSSLGLLVGTLAGLLGVGGGVIIVPGLLVILKYWGFPPNSIMHYATATSMACVLPTVLASAYSYHQRQLIDWDAVKKLLPGMMIGAILGVLLETQLHARVLEILFGLFLLYLAPRFFKHIAQEQSTISYQLPEFPYTLLAGLFVGGMCGLLGIGGSVVLVPILTYYCMPFVLATGTSNVCLAFPALFGALTYIFAGLHLSEHMPNTLGYIFWPAALAIVTFSIPSVRIGSYLGKRLPVPVLKKIFGLVLLVSAIDLLF